MPRTLAVSGTLTVGDDGAVSGNLTVTGNSADPAAPAVDPAVDPAPADTGVITEPDPADVPPYAPDVPATEAPAVPEIADPTASPAPEQAPPADPAPTDPATPADPGSPADPTTAGAEAGTNTTDTATATSGGPAGDSTPGAGPAWPGRDLYRNDHQHTPDTDVRAWQQAATALGANVGPVDGYFGPHTENAVRDLQARAGLPGTGVIDAATWALPFAA